MLDKNEVHVQQRSQEWFDLRKGRFTASKISRLLGKETLAKTKQSIDSYAFEAAVESIYGKEEDTYISEDMQRGITLEPLAFDLFNRLKEHDFITTRESGFFVHGKDAGASPDGILSNNECLEIKCPRRTKFFKIVANGIDEIDKSYIAQMQMQMMCSGSTKCHFMNYYLHEGIEYWHIIEIERDEEMISLIKNRVLMASEIKLNYIEKLHKNAQW